MDAMVFSRSMIAILADSHLGQAPAGLSEFRRAMSQIRAGGASALYFLGDIFQYLIGDRKFSTPLIEAFLSEVREFRSPGRRVYYVEGNRDFFLRGSYLEAEFDRVSREESFQAGEKSFLMVHGDGINERDWPYRFWRFVSKNPIARASLNLVPAGAAHRFVSTMERRLADTNFKHKSRLPVEMIRSFARRRFDRGADVVLLGHFHESWREEIAERRVEIVPPFLEEKRWMEVDADGRIRLVALS
jgi:UDP-2,3-diacylglucosamine hydrolase